MWKIAGCIVSFCQETFFLVTDTAHTHDAALSQRTLAILYLLSAVVWLASRPLNLPHCSIASINVFDLAPSLNSPFSSSAVT